MKRACNYIDQNRIHDLALAGDDPELISRKLNIHVEAVLKFMPVEIEETGEVVNARDAHALENKPPADMGNSLDDEIEELEEEPEIEEEPDE